MPIPAEVYREVHLSPSILSADFSRLGEQISLVMDAGVRMIHFDVMDGHFVPNLSIGPDVLKSVAPLVHGRGGLFSVHLMLTQPEKYVADFIHAGADAVSFHVESGIHHRQTITTIKRLGAGAGVALNPGTDLTRVAELLPLVDFVLVMTVNPGFGGQKHIPAALDKLPRLREALPPEAAIEVDGGINRHNIQHTVQAGANWVVAGSAIFGAADPAAEARILQERAWGAQMYR